MLRIKDLPFDVRVGVWFFPLAPWYCGFPWNSWSHHLSRSDPNLVSECYKTKITSCALAAAILSWEHSQVFVISLSDLCGWMWEGSKLSPCGVNLETDEEISDRCETGVQRYSFTIYQYTGFIGLMIIFHPRNYTKYWCCGLFRGGRIGVYKCVTDVALNNNCDNCKNLQQLVDIQSETLDYLIFFFHL